MVGSRGERLTGDDEITAAAGLMARYCDGEAAAFDALYELVAPRLLGYLTSLIGERAAAEDLLQLTFMKLHEARALYVRDADPVPWLYTIAHRTFLDEARRRKRARVRLTDDGQQAEVEHADLSGAREGTESPGADPELAQMTLAALAQLPSSQREALVLTKLHGRSHAEAAAIVGTTPSAIKLRAHRAYVALRRILGRAEKQS
ncbi:MAG TPA: RNA polymerase sigma factor [Polyangia bacterium]|jgi:RNA polymerase sigma-70 factor (ECF subfamily)|nr:RNA polymerase sigma factor [Polyangia bacterium]HWE27331.1 RNA polymerase sigma factor [Polyangia bacterium]